MTSNFERLCLLKGRINVLPRNNLACKDPNLTALSMAGAELAQVPALAHYIRERQRHQEHKSRL